MKGSRLHLDLFKVFVDLARTRSFSDAALQNNLTQSAVSQQVSFLERSLGARLLERGKGRFALTEAGKTFLDACRGILDAYREMADKIKHPGEISGTVKMETIYSIGLHELALVTKTFMSRHPLVEIYLEYSRSDRIYSDVINDVCDFGIVAYPRRHPFIHEIAFKQERLALACPPQAALARKGTARLTDLAGMEFVAFSKDIPTRRAIDDLLRGSKVSVRIVHEFDNIETIKRAVEIGTGISILPEVTVSREAASGTIVCVPLAGAPRYRPTAILCRRDRVLSRAAQALIRWLSDPTNKG